MKIHSIKKDKRDKDARALAEESRANEARRCFMKYIFHEVSLSSYSYICGNLFKYICVYLNENVCIYVVIVLYLSINLICIYIYMSMYVFM
jgi:hypothetical protein